MILFWVLIAKNYTNVKKQKDRDRLDHKGPQNETNHSFNHYDKVRSQEKSNRKDFKDSGLINNDEYDPRDL